MILCAMRIVMMMVAMMKTLCTPCRCNHSIRIDRCYLCIDEAAFFVHRASREKISEEKHFNLIRACKSILAT